MIAFFQHTLQQVICLLSGTRWIFSLVLIGSTCYVNYYTSFSLWSTSGGFAGSSAWFTLLFTLFLVAGYWISLGKITMPGCTQSRLLLLLLITPFLFALKITVPFHLVFEVTGIELLSKKGNAVSWLGGFLWISLLITVMHRLLEGRWALYWVQKPSRLLPYLLLLLLMVPLVMGAAASESFSEMYPRAQELSRNQLTVIRWSKVAFFEICYLVDFLSIELFFRGMMVAVLSRFLGVQAILPVAFFYFSIHLGKPMPEAMGSFFGALVLGSVALQTKSVWGGWIVHAGIAMLMELLAAFF